MVEVGKVTAVLEVDSSEFESQLDDAKGKIEDFASDAEDLGKVVLSADAGDLEGELDSAKGAVESFASEAEGSGKVQLEADASGVESGASQASSAISDFSSSSVAKLAEIAAAVLIVVEAFGQLSEAVSMAAASEALAMATGLKTGETTVEGFREQGKAIDDFVDAYSVQTGKADEDINAALSKLYGFGYKGAPTADIMEPFKALSSATGSNLATSTNLIEASQIRFGKTMEDNMHIADVWTKAINSSNLDPASISIESLGMAAKEGKMSLEDMAATMSVSSAKALPDPTTAIRMGVMKLSSMEDPVAEINKKTGKVTWKGVTDGTEALKKFGMTASEAKGAPLLDTLEKMHKAGATMADFQAVFGSRTGMLLKNISDNIDGIRGLATEMETTSGITSTSAATMSENLQSSLDQAGKAIEDIKERIGENLAPGMKQMADLFRTSGYDAIMALIEGLETGDFSSFKEKISTLISDVSNMFTDVDYEKIGWDMLHGLQSAWDNIVVPLLSWEGDDTGIQNAMKNVFGPAWEKLRLTAWKVQLQIADQFAPMEAAGVTTFQNLVSVGTTAWNTLLGGFELFINGALEGFATLLEMGGKALGGLSGKAPEEETTKPPQVEAFKAVPVVTTTTSNVPAAWITEAKRLGLDPNAQYINPSTGFMASGADWASRTSDTSKLVLKSKYDVRQQAGGGESKPVESPGEIAAEEARVNRVSGAGYGTAKRGTGWNSPTRVQSRIGAGGDVPAPSTAEKNWTFGALASGGALDQWVSKNIPYAEYIPGMPSPGKVPGENELVSSAITFGKALIANPQETIWKTDLALAEKVSGKGKDIVEVVEGVGVAADTLIKDPFGTTSKAALGLGTDFMATAAAIRNAKVDLGDIKLDTTAKTYAENLAEIQSRSAKGWDDYNAAEKEFEARSQAAGESIEGLSKELSDLYGDLADIAALKPEDLAGPIERATKANYAYDASLNLLANDTQKLAKACEDCAMSEFGLAQEAASDQLFNRSYAGPSGANYLAFLEEEAARGAYHPPAIRVGEDYTTEGRENILDLQAQVQENDAWVANIGANTGLADESVTSLKGTVAEGQNVMPIMADGSQAFSVIAQIRADAARGASMPIYSSGGGYGGSENYLGESGYSANVSVPEYSSGPFGNLPWMANEAYVPRPTLAVVGDRPGGEFVLGADRVGQMLAGGGGPSVQITSQVIIQGDISSAVQLRQILDERDRALEEKLSNASFWQG